MICIACIRRPGAGVVLALLVVMLAWVHAPGCSSNGGAGDGDGDVTTSVPYALDPPAGFTFEDSDRDTATVSVDISDDVPNLPSQRATLTIDPDDVSITPETIEVPQAAAVLTMLVNSNGIPDDCTENDKCLRMQLLLDADGTVSITPDRVNVSEDALPAISSGEFELFMEVFSPRARQVVIDRLTIGFVTTSDFSELSCKQILALRPVQDALGEIKTKGVTFALNEGDEPPAIENSYEMEQVVIFSSGDDDSDSLKGDVTFEKMEGTFVDRTGFDATITQWIQGEGDDVSLCVLARSNHPECDQTVARLESLAFSEENQELDGTFLAVVVERHSAPASECGGAGDYIYGKVTFNQPGSLTDEDSTTDESTDQEPTDEESSDEGLTNEE